MHNVALGRVMRTNLPVEPAGGRGQLEARRQALCLLY